MMIEIIIDAICCFLGGFIAVCICSKYDAWERYRKSVGKDAFKTVYRKVLEAEKEYSYRKNQEAVNDCIRLKNLMNYFKEEICEED